MNIPETELGYAVDADRTVHLRYADHAVGQRTRTVAGAIALADGEPVICRKCWPLPNPRAVRAEPEPKPEAKPED